LATWPTIANNALWLLIAAQHHPLYKITLSVCLSEAFSISDDFFDEF
jgi:hypothetical protein